MTWEGFIVSDVAVEYYNLIGKDYDREQARKNFVKLKHIDYSALHQAVDNLHTRQKKLIDEAKKHAEKLA